MTEDSDRSSQSAATTAATSTSASAPSSAAVTTPEKTTGNRFSFLARLLMLLLWLTLLSALGALGWFTFELKKQLVSIQSENNLLKTADLQTGKKVAFLTRQVQQLSEYEKNNGWFFETESLLSLARQQVLLHHNTEMAGMLLEEADTILAKKPPTLVQQIRSQIQQEQQLLANHHSVNQEALYFDLEKLIQALDETKVVDLSQAGKSVAQTPLSEPQTIAGKVFQALRHALSSMGGYLRIQRNDIAVQALLTPDEQVFLKRNIRLALEKAELALLRNEEKIYTDSLQNAENWVDRYYMIDPTVKQDLLKTIRRLANQPLEAPLPDIHQALDSLRALHTNQLQQESQP